MSAQIHAKLQQFAALTAPYGFGGDKAHASGCTLESCLQLKRASLIPMFTQGKMLPLGPLTDKKVPEEPSEGEDSEVEITAIQELDPLSVAHKSKSE